MKLVCVSRCGAPLKHLNQSWSKTALFGVLLSCAVSGEPAWSADDTGSPIVDPAIAGVLTVPMVGAQTISDGQGNHRILVQPGDLATIEGEIVISATLEVPLSGAAFDNDLNLRVMAIDEPWTPGSATWTSPWTTPGGDVFPDYVANVEIPAGSAEAQLQLDVSEVVRAMADRDVGTNGFVLTVPDYLGEGLSAEDAARFELISSATLSVDVRKITALGFPGEGTRAFIPQIANRENRTID